VSDEGVVALDRTARLELAVATAVLVVTATLAITSPPGTE
jgi:putative copper export protein